MWTEIIKYAITKFQEISRQSFEITQNSEGPNDHYLLGYASGILLVCQFLEVQLGLFKELPLPAPSQAPEPSEPLRELYTELWDRRQKADEQDRESSKPLTKARLVGESQALSYVIKELDKIVNP